MRFIDTWYNIYLNSVLICCSNSKVVCDMNWFVDNIIIKSILKSEALHRNKVAICERNIKVIRMSLLISAVLLFADFIILGSFMKLSVNDELKYFYPILLGVIAILVVLSKQAKSLNAMYLIYSCYLVSVVCAMIASIAVGYSDMVMFVILSSFILAALFLDKSIRINIIILVGFVAYLIVVLIFKGNSDFSQEFLYTIIGAPMAVLIGSFVRTVHLQNLDMKARLKYFAHTDRLTGLSNRRKLFHDLVCVDGKKDRKDITGLGLINIDYFKKYNKRYGHQPGDECLREITSLFRGIIPKYDIDCYRYDADEFVVVFYGYDLFNITSILKEILTGIEELQLAHELSDIGHVTASAGVSSWTGGEDVDCELLLHHSDLALYKAKSSGRNKISVYDERI